MCSSDLIKMIKDELEKDKDNGDLKARLASLTTGVVTIKVGGRTPMEAREKIFMKLKEEEDARRAEEEFKENLRNELYMEETEAAARAKERAEAEKRLRVREELQAAKDFQLKLKADRAAEEKRMEDEFKRKLMEKFAEDERLEQMNA